MSDPAGTEIVRRDDARLSTLERVLGTGDMAQMIEATKANVNAAIQFARDREFVTEYPIMRRGQQVGVRLWFHHPTWQLLGQSFGITAYTEGDPKEVKPGTWQASAVACMIENGQVVGRAVGLCSKNEPGAKGAPPPKANMPDHSIAATAQSRAQRNALRSCLGAVLIAAGFEISDPEGPATQDQWTKLNILERELGFTHKQGHAEAGVDSYKDLTREQASELIERWQAEAAGGDGGPSPSDESSGHRVDNARGVGKAESGSKGSPGLTQASRSVDESAIGATETAEPDESSAGESEGQHSPSAEPPAGDTYPEDATLDQPAPKVQWERAGRHGLTGNAALKQANARFHKGDALFPEVITSYSKLTKRQLAALIDEVLG